MLGGRRFHVAGMEASTLVRAERREAGSAGWIVVHKAEHYYCKEARDEAGMCE